MDLFFNTLVGIGGVIIIIGIIIFMAWLAVNFYILLEKIPDWIMIFLIIIVFGFLIGLFLTYPISNKFYY